MTSLLQGDVLPAPAEPAQAPAEAAAPSWLAGVLLALAGCLALLAVLGPLVTGVVRYRSSTTMLHQAEGLDAFVLVGVVPLAVLAAVLVARRHPAGPLLALTPAGFSAYMLPQYVVGPEPLLHDGNGERVFPLVVAAFVLSAVALFGSWPSARAPGWPGRQWRRRAALLLALAAFVVGGMYLANGFLSATWDFPAYVAERVASTEHDEHPTSFWLVAFLDLGLVVPLTVATAVGLLRRRPWAARAFYAVLGWYAAVPASVAAMAVTMLVLDDPAASAGRTAVVTAAAAVFLLLAGRTFVPLLRRSAWTTRDD